MYMINLNIVQIIGLGIILFGAVSEKSWKIVLFGSLIIIIGGLLI